ncbi:C4-dicarboxylate transport protein [Campylobacter sputorum subsp. bubulus]|uniref:C4-dicarboxylate transport protein n=1 Tax=Campylobacter sputorum subsp. sputorum TaxID=32024 RepID=A0A381DHW0_9BACT|nr:cation:dicarboxylase symporter family transporter [Campylobacter sputorum]ASM35328.1 C4-dicarboxylate transport protein [Campylobacter sputorum aubsp. sputorum RM3237]KAB0582928.1 cation:dicarboxylase symporter family transporter [Campylobacter sputorum subsp. sputorum]QEL05520.1 C4-dicarboxylate transport protein [Campylobacter sputorum subsp. sputorum]SUX08661.1 C4-dicarboxylate transport protein [Campylobacter sputorum subsp. bubulus]SUX10283.1 C4-dicarboxylate transport protein [Campylo
MKTLTKKSRTIKLLTNLAFWVVFGIIAGILLGIINPPLAESHTVKQGAVIFIKVLKMMIGPIIFLTIVSGIAGLHSLKELGSIGLKAFIYFEVVSTLALAIGIAVPKILQPGSGMNLKIEDLDTKGVDKFITQSKNIALDPNASPIENMFNEIWHILKGAVPSDPITPFITGNTIQVLFMAIVTAVIISFLSHKHKDIIMKPIISLQHIVLKILSIFMWFSPIAAFSAMAYLIGHFGLNTLWGMINLLLVMLFSCCLFIFGILGIICYFAKINIFKFMRFISKEVLIVFATSSSETALAPLMQKLEKAGIQRGSVGLIIPTGYSFNLDCTNIYLAMSVIFLAQAFNIDLSFMHLLMTLLILMITSKGAVGVTGSGFIILAGTLSALDVIPVATVAVLLGVDKFMSEMRAVGNLCGNAVGCLIVSIWDKKVDLTKFRYALDHPEEF